MHHFYLRAWITVSRQQSSWRNAFLSSALRVPSTDENPQEKLASAGGRIAQEGLIGQKPASPPHCLRPLDCIKSWELICEGISFRAEAMPSELGRSKFLGNDKPTLATSAELKHELKTVPFPVQLSGLGTYKIKLPEMFQDGTTLYSVELDKSLACDSIESLDTVNVGKSGCSPFRLLANSIRAREDHGNVSPKYRGAAYLLDAPLAAFCGYNPHRTSWGKYDVALAMILSIHHMDYASSTLLTSTVTQVILTDKALGEYRDQQRDVRVHITPSRTEGAHDHTTEAE
nr:hypothetical protein Iba_chr12eCG2760 [Ipomoea batatas]